MVVPYRKHIFFPIFWEQPGWDVNTVLYYTHVSNVTNEHGHILALANISLSVRDNIIVDYRQEIQELMLKS